MRILALDLGRKRIGVAVSDELCLVARTLTTLQARGRNADTAAIAALVLPRWWPSRRPGA
jgi:RNase H-fold protein (predicted Holliday junction resolvase)